MGVVKARLSRAARSVFILAAALAGVDLLVKFALVRSLEHDSHLTDFVLFSVQVAYNSGATFSAVSWLPQAVVAVAVALLVGGLGAVVVRSAARLPALSRAGAALLLGGALGNLVDRLDGAGVVDYLHTGWFPTFNLADVFVVAGAGLLVLGTLRGLVRKKRYRR